MKKSLVASCLLALALSSSAEAKMVTYKIGDKEFEGYLTGNGKKGSVLVVHNWLGLTDETKSKADQLSKLGYTVFAADIYGKGVRPKNQDEAKAQTAPFYTNRSLLRERVAGALQELRKLSQGPKNKFAALGYCFGGTTVLELARSGADVQAVVSFHGGLDSPKPEDGKNIKAKVLALHGADDPFVSAENLNKFESEMKDSKVDWQLVKYGGAVHSFTDKNAGSDNSKGAAYNESADLRSWASMKSFLETSFK
jgi:dienelactone hydrolase